MVTRYRTSWSEIQEQMNEFALSHTVRYRDPLNKKRFAVPFKTAEKAKAKMDQLKRDGVKEIEITKDILRGKFKEEVEIQESDAYDNNRYMMKKYMGQILARPDNSNTKDGKDHVYAPNAKIAKQLYSQGKKLYKENVGDFYQSKMTPQQIQNIKKTWQGKKASDVTPAVKAMIKRLDIPTQLAIRQANIPHISKLVEDASKDAENMAKLRTRQMSLQTKLKDLDPGEPKDKTTMAITKNDIETIQMKMDQLRSKMKKEQVHPAKSLIEAITAVKNKAEKTGMPYSILKKVYDRGMAAWKGGHRPGTTSQQWAMARVNSFVTKSSGTWGKADKDLAAKVRSKK